MLEGSSAMFASAFVAPWKPVYRSFSYRLALLLSATYMVLMPLAYLAAIGGIAWVVYWHFSHDAGMLTAARGRAAILAVSLYILPGILGAALILFLLKPLLLLFARSEHDDAIEIFPSEEPRLFGIVQAICTAMRAPVPERIFIDCSPNAAAQVLGGGFGFFGRQKLGLHIGLPLVAGMDANSFVGILAHEFGHFSQGIGMRSTIIFSKITQWIGTAAYSRSGLDDNIDSLRESQEGYAALLAMLLSLCLWITRLVLKVVFFTGYAISRIMGRRMEFDADTHEARFVGSAAAIGTWPKILSLTIASHDAETKVAEQWHNRTLPDDLPGLIAALARRQSPEAKASIKQELENRSTGWFDTHPAAGVRIAHMQALAEPGVFRLDEPATALFTNFAAASKRASYNHYKARVGEYIFSATFVPSSQLFGSHEEEAVRVASAGSFLGFDLPDWRPLSLSLSELAPSDDPKQTWEKVRTAKRQLQSASSAAAKSIEDYVDADQKLVQVSAAPAAFSIGISKLKKDLRFAFNTSSAMHAEKTRSSEKISEAAARIDDALEAANIRICANLRLLATKGIEKKVPGAGKLRERAELLLPAHAALRNALPKMREFRENFQKGALLIAYMQDAGTRDKAREAMRPISDQLRDQILSLRQDWGGIRSPYPGVDGETNLGGFVVRNSPAWREYDQIFGAAGDMLDKYTETQRRVNLELIEIAATTEAALSGSPAREQAAAAQ